MFSVRNLVTGEKLPQPRRGGGLISPHLTGSKDQGPQKERNSFYWDGRRAG